MLKKRKQLNNNLPTQHRPHHPNKPNNLRRIRNLNPLNNNPSKSKTNKWSRSIHNPYKYPAKITKQITYI